MQVIPYHFFTGLGGLEGCLRFVIFYPLPFYRSFRGFYWLFWLLVFGHQLFPSLSCLIIASLAF